MNSIRDVVHFFSLYLPYSTHIINKFCFLVKPCPTSVQNDVGKIIRHLHCILLNLGRWVNACSIACSLQENLALLLILNGERGFLLSERTTVVGGKTGSSLCTSRWTAPGHPQRQYFCLPRGIYIAKEIKAGGALSSQRVQRRKQDRILNRPRLDLFVLSAHDRAPSLLLSAPKHGHISNNLS